MNKELKQEIKSLIGYTLHLLDETDQGKTHRRDAIEANIFRIISLIPREETHDG